MEDMNWYLKKFNLLTQTSPREDSFQDLIIYPLIDSILQLTLHQEFDFVDSKNFIKNNTKIHDSRAYSLLTKAVPDMLIAKNFFIITGN